MVSVILEYPISAVVCAMIVGFYLGFGAAALLAAGRYADSRAGYKEGQP